MQFYLVSEQIAIKMKRPVFARKLSRVDQIFRDKIRLVFRNVFQGMNATSRYVRYVQTLAVNR